MGSLDEIERLLPPPQYSQISFAKRVVGSFTLFSGRTHSAQVSLSLFLPHKRYNLRIGGSFVTFYLLDPSVRPSPSLHVKCCR